MCCLTQRIQMSGIADTWSVKGITQPWERSLDALNTHDDAYALSIAGGVTTALILPGSASAIGSSSFPVVLLSITSCISACGRFFCVSSHPCVFAGYMRIGGQAFTIKLRPTKERSPSAMLVEPAASVVYDGNGTRSWGVVSNGEGEGGGWLRWRQMK